MPLVKPDINALARDRIATIRQTLGGTSLDNTTAVLRELWGTSDKPASVHTSFVGRKDINTEWMGRVDGRTT